MTILSIDASTKSSGWAIYEGTQLKDYGCITSSSTDLFKRIHKMVDEIDNLISTNSISKLILEEVRPDETGARSNLATHKALMFLQGAIAMMIHDKYPKVTIDYLYPSEWRKCCKIKTGRGVVRETVKQRDIRFVQETFGITVNDDIADAIGLGYAHLHPGGEEEEMISWGE
jgi:Holliday junction resolvasome RuvABC endonuclease subunit